MANGPHVLRRAGVVRDRSRGQGGLHRIGAVRPGESPGQANRLYFICSLRAQAFPEPPLPIPCRTGGGSRTAPTRCLLLAGQGAAPAPGGKVILLGQDLAQLEDLVAQRGGLLELERLGGPLHLLLELLDHPSEFVVR